MQHQFEAVFMFLYDVGRSVDLSHTTRLIPVSQEKRLIASRDTPASLSIPEPLQRQIAVLTRSDTMPFEELRLSAKIYEDGVISLMARAQTKAELEQLHTLRGLKFRDSPEGDEVTISEWVHSQFLSLLEQIKPAITFGEYESVDDQRETYAAFCLTDRVPNPERFVEAHAQYLSTFLLGENTELKLHRTQVKSTLDHRFSFKDTELIILDLDRCFIIDPEHDYEDILLILELANYQLLELRTLDRLLDLWLDQAEDDIRRVYLKRSHGLRSLSRKLGGLLPLRLDSLFILENLENTAKIIGDYYLGQVYEHLCQLMGTGTWERSVRRRLEALQEIYSMAKVDVNERLLLIMEILVVLLIGFEIVALLFPLLPHG
jgi:hypothetical protein